MRVLFYVNQILLSELTGQASFERGLIDALTRMVEHEPDSRMVLFTARAPSDPQPSSEAAIGLALNKASYVGYVTHQIQLIWRLCRELWRYRKCDVAMYVRYAPSMVAPALGAILFQRPLVFRTGPVLPNLRIHQKTNNPLVLWTVACALWIHCRVSAGIIVATERIAQWVAKTFPFARDKLVVVSNGVDCEKFKPVVCDRTRWRLPPGFVLGFVGTLIKDQGLGTVIEAIGQLATDGGPVPHLLVVGDGPESQSLQQLARQVGAEGNITWAGRHPPDDVPFAIAACNVMLLPLTKAALEVRGTSAMKLFEYLACDRYVLASRCRDTQFLGEHGLGTLVDPDDVNAWAAAIRAEMAQAARDSDGRARGLVLARHTFDSVADKIWSVIWNRRESAKR